MKKRISKTGTVEHRNNGHLNNGMRRNNRQIAYYGAFYVVNSGKIHALVEKEKDKYIERLLHSKFQSI